MPATLRPTPADRVKPGDTVDLEQLFASDERPVVAFRLTNDSMIDLHVRAGDYVFVEVGAVPRAGQVVAVVVEGQKAPRLRRWCPDGDAMVNLEAADGGRTPPIRVHRNAAAVVGVMIGIIRTCR
jgi:SOS-response transcriptional repressor LexA